jgi:hypothetical protein
MKPPKSWAAQAVNTSKDLCKQVEIYFFHAYLNPPASPDFLISTKIKEEKTDIQIWRGIVKAQ